MLQSIAWLSVCVNFRCFSATSSGGHRGFVRDVESCVLAKLTRETVVILGGWPKRALCRVSGMAKFSVRRYSDPYYVIGLKEAIVKISAQKQCPNEERIVRSVLQEFDWSKSEIIKQLKFAVKDGLILQVTTFSSHGSTKGIPQTAYRIQRKDGEDDVSMKFDLCANTRSFHKRQITSCAIFHGF